MIAQQPGGGDSGGIGAGGLQAVVQELSQGIAQQVTKMLTAQAGMLIYHNFTLTQSAIGSYYSV